MGENNNIKEFTAADIEKYWKGKLSAAEMHALEKAAMDDPFLADALEGYTNTTDATSDLDNLGEKLNKRVVAMAPVVALKQKRFTWLRVAAAIIIIAGVGLLVQQLALNNKNERSIVNVEKAKENNADVATNKNQQKSDTPQTTTSNFSDTSTFKANEKKLDKEKTSIGAFALSVKDTAKNTDDRLAGDVKIDDSKKDLEGKSAPTVVTAQRKEKSFREKEAFGRTALDSTKPLNQPTGSAAAKSNDAEVLYDLNKNAANFLSNKYNYRVVDAQNNPVPFANVMNTRDNVGTYTDIRGNFNLISSDSILNVQIRSLGYNATNYKLVPSTQAGELVLKEDNEARRQILAQNRKVVSSVTRKDSAELEEPEVGWGNYNTYIANNIQIPDNIRAKNTRSDVELSFYIDKAGHPTNIKITKSSQCKVCDEEAKRLLKEGPKWKRKGKKSKTTISIAVDQK